jgi:multidrug resistance efflux pump
LQAQHDLDLDHVLAPADAEVIKVLVQAGNAVSAQDHQPAFVLLPERPLIIRAEVNESYVSRIKPGLAAEVTLEADPGQPALAASVLRVSRVLETGHLSEEPQMARAFECILALKQTPETLAQALRIGQTVLVKFND